MRGSFSYWTLVKTGHIIIIKPMAMAIMNMNFDITIRWRKLRTNRYAIEFGSIECASDAGSEFSKNNSYNHCDEYKWCEKSVKYA